VVTLPADDDRPPERPTLRVIRGDATPEEIAALVAVLMAQAAGSASPAASARSARSAWSDRSQQLHAPIRPAPGAWRRSALPGYR
jgi:Acyl-CoA carboxylase epsilon subunit